MQNKSFVGITVHFLEKTQLLNGTFGVFELTESHTAAYLGRELTEIFTNWGVSTEKVTAVVTDNDSTVMKVNRDIFGDKKIIPCFAHTVNLVVTQSIDKSVDCSALISRVRDIVKYIKRSVNASDELRKKQKDAGATEGHIKKLILDVKTRWNSCFYMLERFVELVSIISDILLTRPEAPAMVTSGELDCVKETIKLLRPFENLTKEISSDSYVTVSKIIPLVSCVRDVLDNIKPKNEVTIQLKLELEKQLTKRFDKLEHSSILAIATMLDPRFKLIHFKDAVAKSKVINYSNSFIRDIDKSSKSESSDESDKDKEETTFDIWNYHKQLAHKNIKNKHYSSTSLLDKNESEVQMYLASPVTPIKRDQDVVEIWEDMKSLFPALYKVAIKYLPVVATSVPSERLFSKAGATITQQRNRLTGKRLSKLLFLNSLDSIVG